MDQATGIAEKSMRFFPLHLDIRGKTVVIIGGGSVAERKCNSLLRAGAKVRVISPQINAGMKKLAAEGRIEHCERQYRQGDLTDARLVFAATDHRETNAAVASEAAARDIPANIADAPEKSTFISPAVIARGDLLITISTGGKSPALAGKIRAELEEHFGVEYELTLQLLGAVREKLLTEKQGSQYNKKLIDTLLSHNLPELYRNKSFNEIDRLLRDIFGPEFTLTALGVGIKDPA